MRPLPEMETPKPTTITTRSNHLSPPTPSLPSTRPSCNPQIRDCSWWPYTNPSDFGANAATIVILLLCALICALALNTAIRCFTRSNANNNNNDDDDNSTEPRQNNQTGKPDLELGLEPPLVAPKVVYTKGGLEVGDGDCAICLSEFVEGEDIRVMGRCKHGFHARCIDKWLSTHYSCPTCRDSCLASSSSSSSSATLEIGAHQNSLPTIETVDPPRVIIYAAPSNICL